jgi:hypothetical protein
VNQKKEVKLCKLTRAVIREQKIRAWGHSLTESLSGDFGAYIHIVQLRDELADMTEAAALTAACNWKLKHNLANATGICRTTGTINREMKHNRHI